MVTIEQWENAVKVALKERYSNLRAPELEHTSGADDRTHTHTRAGGFGPRQQVLGAGLCGIQVCKGGVCAEVVSG